MTKQFTKEDIKNMKKIKIEDLLQAYFSKQEPKLIKHKDGFEILFPDKTFKKNFVLSGCVRDNNSLHLSFMSDFEKDLTIEDDEMESYDVNFNKNNALSENNSSKRTPRGRDKMTLPRYSKKKRRGKR